MKEIAIWNIDGQVEDVVKLKEDAYPVLGKRGLF